jgi:hypothetical protein
VREGLERPPLRGLTDQEIKDVAGGNKFVSYTNSDGSVFTEEWSDDGNTFYGLTADWSGAGSSSSDSFNWGWGAIATAGGVYTGAEYGTAAAEGIGMAVEYGVIGAEYGALAGPVGVAVGVVVGAAAGYAVYTYGPQVLQSIDSALQ